MRYAPRPRTARKLGANLFNLGPHLLAARNDFLVAQFIGGGRGPRHHVNNAVTEGEQFVLFGRVEQSWRETAGEECGPEAIAGPAEVMSDCGGIQPRIGCRRRAPSTRERSRRGRSCSPRRVARRESASRSPFCFSGLRGRRRLIVGAALRPSGRVEADGDREADSRRATRRGEQDRPRRDRSRVEGALLRHQSGAVYRRNSDITSAGPAIASGPHSSPAVSRHDCSTLPKRTNCSPSVTALLTWWRGATATADELSDEKSLRAARRCGQGEEILARASSPSSASEHIASPSRNRSRGRTPDELARATRASGCCRTPAA